MFIEDDPNILMEFPWKVLIKIFPNVLLKYMVHHIVCHPEKNRCLFLECAWEKVCLVPFDHRKQSKISPFQPFIASVLRRLSVMSKNPKQTLWCAKERNEGSLMDIIFHSASWFCFLVTSTNARLRFSNVQPSTPFSLSQSWKKSQNYLTRFRSLPYFLLSSFIWN